MNTAVLCDQNTERVDIIIGWCMTRKNNNKSDVSVWSTRYCVVGRFVPHVFSRTVAAVDTKRGYVGMCNGRSAQQESGAALSKNSMFTAGT